MTKKNKEKLLMFLDGLAFFSIVLGMLTFIVIGIIALTKL